MPLIMFLDRSSVKYIGGWEHGLGVIAAPEKDFASDIRRLGKSEI